MDIFEYQFSHLFKNLMGRKILPYMIMQRLYELCIVMAKYISMPVLMRVLPTPATPLASNYWRPVGVSTRPPMIHNMPALGTLSSYMPATREATRNVDKMSKTSFRTCSEVFKKMLL